MGTTKVGRSVDSTGHGQASCGWEIRLKSPHEAERDRLANDRTWATLRQSTPHNPIEQKIR
ncbi:MAG: hypothetical protein EA381_03005 [Planctomycetaceae bacterium]|nr:MAG: hypothetical protein EA381_03005 [Planctomycetaceae bacterium]